MDVTPNAGMAQSPWISSYECLGLRWDEQHVPYRIKEGKYGFVSRNEKIKTLGQLSLKILRVFVIVSLHWYYDWGENKYGFVSGKQQMHVSLHYFYNCEIMWKLWRWFKIKTTFINKNLARWKGIKCPGEHDVLSYFFFVLKSKRDQILTKCICKNKKAFRQPFVRNWKKYRWKRISEICSNMNIHFTSNILN